MSYEARLAVLVVGLIVAGCNGGGGPAAQPPTPEQFDPADGQRLSEAIQFKATGFSPSLGAGELPVHGDYYDPFEWPPGFISGPSPMTVARGQVVSFFLKVSPNDFVASEPNYPLDALYAQIPGSDRLFTFNPDESWITERPLPDEIALSFEISIPDAVGDGDFCILFSARNSEAVSYASAPVCFQIRGDTPYDLTAKSCFNPEYWTPGAETEEAFEVIHPNGDVVATRTVHRGVEQTPACQTLVRRQQLINGEASADELCYEVDTTVPSVALSHDLQRYDLLPGQFFNVEGVPSPQGTYEQRTVYFGKERVSVGVGTFDACVFGVDRRYAVGSSGSSNTRRLAYAQGNGLLIRNEFYEFYGTELLLSTELASATINGNPVSGE